jgi:hypothetical protein
MTSATPGEKAIRIGEILTLVSIVISLIVGFSSFTPRVSILEQKVEALQEELEANSQVTARVHDDVIRLNEYLEMRKRQGISLPKEEPR